MFLILFIFLNFSLQDLFSEFGAVRRAGVNYDASGRSLGTGFVLFERRSDAIQAMSAYNNVLLDGLLISNSAKISFFTFQGVQCT